MAKPRSVRILLLANDGSSVGHVSRALAVARGLVKEGARRKLEIRILLVTASDATSLIESQRIPYVRLPSRASTEHRSWTELERRSVMAGVLGGAVAGFLPDILVVDTFPAGPHFEAEHIVDQVPCRVLIRRTIRSDCIDAPEVRSLLEGYAKAILPDDPITLPQHPLPIASVSVPPITLLERNEMLGREEARRELGIASGKVALLAFGGGSDAAALERVRSVAECLRKSTRYRPFLAGGPLSSVATVDAVSSIPLQKYLAAFDVAVASAGYNTAHELAKGGVRTVLFGCPRAFDDQLGRAQRFDRAGLAVALDDFDTGSVLAALRRAESLERPSLPPDGARAAAQIILDELDR